MNEAQLSQAAHVLRLLNEATRESRLVLTDGMLQDANGRILGIVRLNEADDTYILDTRSL